MIENRDSLKKGRPLKWDPDKKKGTDKRGVYD